MKILHVITGLDRGGAETLLINIFQKIDKVNYKFEFLVYGNKSYEYENIIEELGGKISRIDGPNDIGMMRFIKTLVKKFKKEKYDVVHVHNLFNCGPVVFAAFIANVKKRISHSHNTQPLEENVTLKKKLYFFIAKILINIFSTHKLACSIEAGKFLYYRNNFEVIKNGIETEKFKFSINSREKIRKEYNISEDVLVIGHIGRFSEQKNHTFLIDIFNEINNKNTNALLLLLGNGILQKNIVEKVKLLGLEEKVLFLGSKENANEFYSAFDCFLFPSLFEGLPFTLIEAQCNGVPIYASSEISKEVDISDKIHFIELKKGPNEWADIILDTNSFASHESDEKSIIKSGYAIKETVKRLEEIYKGE